MIRAPLPTGPAAARTANPGATVTRIRALVVAAGLLATPAAAAGTGDLPLFELGVLAAGGTVPDYPAAGENHFRAIGLPYFAYRGEILRSDEKGLLRGRIVNTDRLELDVSLKGSLPVDSDKNDARRGMPDLDWLGEIGPRLQVRLARAPAGNAKVELELPVRAAFSTDLSDLDYRGIIFAPELAYQHEDFLGRDIQVKLGVSSTFATSELTEYLYEVPSGFATASRPAYAADAGYVGSALQLVAFHPLNRRWRLFGGVRTDFHHGSANEDSPLFREKTTYTAGVGVIWSFYQSAARGVE
jgi:outer membrane protein